MVSETTLGTFTVVKDERECENCPQSLISSIRISINPSGFNGSEAEGYSGVNFQIEVQRRTVSVLCQPGDK